MSPFNKEQVRAAVTLGQHLFEKNYKEFVAPAASDCYLTSDEKIYFAVAVAYHHRASLRAENGTLIVLAAPEYIGALTTARRIDLPPPKTLSIFYEKEES